MTIGPRTSTGRSARRAFLVSALLSAALACDDPNDPARDALDANRELWRSHEIVDYRYEYRLDCFCAGPGSEPVAIEVSDGEVVRVTLLLTSEEVPPSELSDYPTVDRLFEMMEEWLSRDPYDVSADYHPELGYPTNVFIDFIENAIDEELGFQASGLVEF